MSFAAGADAYDRFMGRYSTLLTPQFAAGGGFVEVRDNRVIILSDVAELAAEIDVERARRSLAEAERQITTVHDVEVEARLRRAHVRLEVAGGLSPVGGGGAH